MRVKKYVERDKSQEKGIWKHPEKIGQKVPSSEVMDVKKDPADVFPININAAQQDMLELLTRHWSGLFPANH